VDFSACLQEGARSSFDHNFPLCRDRNTDLLNVSQIDNGVLREELEKRAAHLHEASLKQGQDGVLFSKVFTQLQQRFHKALGDLEGERQTTRALARQVREFEQERQAAEREREAQREWERQIHVDIQEREQETLARAEEMSRRLVAMESVLGAERAARQAEASRAEEHGKGRLRELASLRAVMLEIDEVCAEIAVVSSEVMNSVEEQRAETRAALRDINAEREAGRRALVRSIWQMQMALCEAQDFLEETAASSAADAKRVGEELERAQLVQHSTDRRLRALEHRERAADEERSLLAGQIAAMVEDARTLEAAGVEVWREMEREQALFAETMTCLHREVEAGWYLERILDASCAQMSALLSPVEDGMLLLEGCLRQVNSAQHLQQQEFRGRLRSTANLCHNLAFELQVLRADVRAHEEVAAQKGEFEREAAVLRARNEALLQELRHEQQARRALEEAAHEMEDERRVSEEDRREMEEAILQHAAEKAALEQASRQQASDLLACRMQLELQQDLTAAEAVVGEAACAAAAAAQEKLGAAWFSCEDLLPQVAEARAVLEDIANEASARGEGMLEEEARAKQEEEDAARGREGKLAALQGEIEVLLRKLRVAATENQVCLRGGVGYVIAGLRNIMFDAPWAMIIMCASLSLARARSLFLSLSLSRSRSRSLPPSLCLSVSLSRSLAGVRARAIESGRQVERQCHKACALCARNG
jgi:hypothetical protein